MAADPNPVLRAELEAALAVLAPQIRGLHDWATPVSISPELVGEINDEIVVRERRRDLIQKVLDDLDQAFADLKTLEVDGYPELPPVSLTANLFNELQGQLSDVEAATAVFSEQASSLTVSFGAPVAKEP